MDPNLFYDPNLFHLDWERTFEALSTIVVLSFIVERALAIVFENRIFLAWYGGAAPAKPSNGNKTPARKGIKELGAFAVALALCVTWKFDALSIIVLDDRNHALGYALTAGVIAGGSKGSMKLFHDVFNWKGGALREYQEAMKPAKKK